MAPGREKALAAGCDDFDTKPAEMCRLLEKIKALNTLNRKRRVTFCCTCSGLLLADFVAKVFLHW
jgi:hypothetical protein